MTSQPKGHTMTAPTIRATADVTLTGGSGESFAAGDIIPPGNAADYLLSLGLAATDTPTAPAASRKES